MTNKAEFGRLFEDALNEAADNVEHVLGRAIPRTFIIELYCAGISGRAMSVTDALDHLFLNSGLFFKIIDVAIKKVGSKRTLAFVRVSGHAPTTFDMTWNPVDKGPFKQLFAQPEVDEAF